MIEAKVATLNCKDPYNLRRRCGHEASHVTWKCSTMEYMQNRLCQLCKNDSHLASARCWIS
jgi:hypothetical protein